MTNELHLSPKHLSPGRPNKSPPANPAQAKNRPALFTFNNVKGDSNLDGWLRVLYRLDCVIEAKAEEFDALYPEWVTGKITLLFLKRRSGGTEGRHPQFVQWFYTPRGRWLYDRLSYPKPANRADDGSEEGAEEGEFKVRRGRPRKNPIPTRAQRRARGVSVVERLSKFRAMDAVRAKATELMKELIKLIHRREAMVSMFNNFKRQILSSTTRSLKFVEEQEGQLEARLKAAQQLRSDVVANRKAYTQRAHEALALDAVPDPKSTPRVDSHGKTRPYVERTSKGRPEGVDTT